MDKTRLTYDLWFTEWASRSKTTGLGATPVEAFEIATGVELLDMVRLGRRIIRRSSKIDQVRHGEAAIVRRVVTSP